MGQLLSRKNALKELAKYTDARSERKGDEEISPAEILLLDALLYISAIKEYEDANGQKSNYKQDKQDEVFYSRIKFIARSLGIYPIKEEYRRYYLVRTKMKHATGVVAVKNNYERGRKIRIYSFLKTEPVKSEPKVDYAYGSLVQNSV